MRTFVLALVVGIMTLGGLTVTPTHAEAREWRSSGDVVTVAWRGGSHYRSWRGGSHYYYNPGYYSGYNSYYYPSTTYYPSYYYNPGYNYYSSPVYPSYVAPTYPYYYRHWGR